MPVLSASIDDAVTASPLVVSRQMDQGAVLMNTASGDCFELNSVGASVWDFIGRGLGLEAIVAEMVKKYNVDEATARADLLLLVNDLAGRGIVHVSRR
jgi:hypothetical protein